MRLNAYLARAGVASRRGADELIKSGRVSVNGKVAGLDTKVLEVDNVRIDGRKIEVQKLRYILLYKPAGYVTTLKDPRGRRKVIDLIKIPERVVPVGRLDYDTSGLLLLTNDGQLAHRLMHPSFEMPKNYIAQVKSAVAEEKLTRLQEGVKLEDGMTAPAHARKLAANKIELTVHEGRKHQVKRMLAAVGLPVKNLHRSKYGPLSLGKLKAGQWRELTAEEIDQLKGSVR